MFRWPLLYNDSTEVGGRLIEFIAIECYSPALDWRKKYVNTISRFTERYYADTIQVFLNELLE